MGIDYWGECEEGTTGCTDPEAMNYNTDATEPDGSCLYDCSGCFSAGCDEGYSCWNINEFCVSSGCQYDENGNAWATDDCGGGSCVANEPTIGDICIFEANSYYSYSAGIVDCEGQCVAYDLHNKDGDGICDVGEDLQLNCPEFDCDGGDCGQIEINGECVDAPECPINDYCVLDFIEDGLLNVQDIVGIVNCILEGEDCPCGDVNDDGSIDVVDIVWIVDILMWGNSYVCFVCSDNDGDTCDDCSSGSYDPANDGWDYDGDGICDDGDMDSDNDGTIDSEDSQPNNEYECSDTDGDGCDDCSSGTYDPLNDGTDSDGDGICDLGDADNCGSTPDWSIIPQWDPGYWATMTATLVLLDGESFSAEDDMFAAIDSDGYIVGYGITLIPPFGPYSGSVLFQMAIGDSEIGGQIHFRYFDESTCLMYEIDETYIFNTNDILGDVFNPFILRVKTS